MPKPSSIHGARLDPSERRPGAVDHALLFRRVRRRDGRRSGFAREAMVGRVAVDHRNRLGRSHHAFPAPCVEALSNEGVDTLLWQLRAVNPVLASTAVTEYPFAKGQGRRFRFDLCWISKAVALEVDGGSWVGGRHVTGAGFEQDCIKLSMAAALGWRCLRVTPRMIRDGQALTLLLAALGWTGPTQHDASSSG